MLPRHTAVTGQCGGKCAYSITARSAVDLRSSHLAENRSITPAVPRGQQPGVVHRLPGECSLLILRSARQNRLPGDLSAPC